MDKHYLFGLQVPTRPRFKTQEYPITRLYIYIYQAFHDLAQLPGLDKATQLNKAFFCVKNAITDINLGFNYPIWIDFSVKPDVEKLKPGFSV